MRVAVFSDIHSNLEALTAVLEECQRQRVELYLCGGDVVGYGANPKECISLLAKIKAICVAGNHDWAVSGRLDASHFTDDGKAAVMWTRNQISFDIIQALNNLNLVYKDSQLIMVHASLYHPENFIYMDDFEVAKKTFDLMDRSICFIGHTHVPQIYIQHNHNIYLSPILEMEVNPQYKYIVNLGSVGQPRDGNPLASFCIYDTTSQMLEVKRTRYDINKAQQKIREAGLPEKLASRLSLGR